MRATGPLLAFAVLCHVAGPARAQTEAVVYGRIVAGIDYATRVSTDGVTSGSRLTAANNQWLTSIFGFRGAEDLGGGVSAFYRLETGFESTSGMALGTPLFNRFAFVGIGSAAAGQVRLGRFGSISNDVWCIDPMGQQWLGSAALVKGRNWLDARNTIQLHTPELGGFSAIFQYTPGDRADAAASPRKGGVSLAYVQPAFEIRAIYDFVRDAAGRYSDPYSASRETTVGGTWTVGRARLYAGHQTLSAPDAAPGKPGRITHAWAGLKYQATPAVELLGAVYAVHGNRGAARGALYTVGANVSLSPRTVLYGTAGRIVNGAGGTFSVRYWEPHRPGDEQTSLYAGISHSY